MAVICPACKYDFTVAHAHLHHCLACNAHFDPVTGEIATVTYGGSELPAPNVEGSDGVS